MVKFYGKREKNLICFFVCRLFITKTCTDVFIFMLYLFLNNEKRSAQIRESVITKLKLNWLINGKEHPKWMLLCKGRK